MSTTLAHKPIYTPYPPELEKKCILCNSRVSFEYPGKKRWIIDFTHKFSEIRYYYRCSNSKCHNHKHPFNPSQNYCFPNKQYSQSVWKWIAREAKIYHAKPSQIMTRISDRFAMSISENTIRNIIDEVDVFLEHNMDEKTYKIVQDQGKIVLSLDGQRPEDGKDALWLFVDLISNRVLDIQILSSADHLTLHQCVDGILKKYQVSLTGLLSDKQGSIVKMHDKFYPTIPHQYCQFHFLQNIWNFIEAKDSSMQKALANAIKHLPITSRDKTASITIPDVGIVNYRKYFSKIESDLRKLIKSRGKKFEKLRGIMSYQRIDAYLRNIDELCMEKDENHRVTKILLKTSDRLHTELEQQLSTYRGCIDLNKKFQGIRTAMNQTEESKEIHKRKIAAIFESIWESVEKKAQKFEHIRAFLPKVNATFVEIQEQWVRLHKSYERGLFTYYDFPVKERTNSRMEQHIGQQKGRLVSRSGKANVSRQIRVRGGFELKYSYSTNEEIKEYIESMEGSYSPEDIKIGLKELEKRQQKESNEWQTRINGKKALLELYDKGNNQKKT